MILMLINMKIIQVIMMIIMMPIINTNTGTSAGDRLEARRGFLAAHRSMWVCEGKYKNNTNNT